MQVNVTNIHGMAATSTAQRAQNDFTQSLRPLGIREFGLFAFNASMEDPGPRHARIDGINAAIHRGDIVIFQTPTWMGYEFESDYLNQLHAYGAKVAIFVEDVIPLMFKANYDDWMGPYIDLYNRADLLILPSPNMAQRLREAGLTVTNIVYQGLWDHPMTYVPAPATFKRELTFLGNQDRFPFTKDWYQETTLRLFAQVDQSEHRDHVEYVGFVPEQELTFQLNRGFGLCWSENTPTQAERTYSTMNVSFKLSTYLAAGMPVIANQDIATAQIIKENGLGLLASDLDEADHLVQTISERDYQAMAARVQRFGTLLRQGYMAKRILTATVQQLLAPDWQELRRQG